MKKYAPDALLLAIAALTVCFSVMDGPPSLLCRYGLYDDKAGHFAAYFALFAALYLRLDRIPVKFPATFAILVCQGLSVALEFAQLDIPSRSGLDIGDLKANSSGILASLSVVLCLKNLPHIPRPAKKLVDTASPPDY